MNRVRKRKIMCVCVCVYIYTHTEREKARQRETEKEYMSVYVCIYLLGEIYTHYFFCPRILTHTEMDAKGSSSL